MEHPFLAHFGTTEQVVNTTLTYTVEVKIFLIDMANMLASS